MKDAGFAHIGTGSRLPARTRLPRRHARPISSPLLETSIDMRTRRYRFRSSALTISASMKLRPQLRMVQQAAHPDAHIIFGAFIDENMDDEIRVVVIATGFDNVPNSAKMSMDGNKDKDSGSTGLFTEAATAAADKKPARASASKPSSDVGSDDAAFDVLMRIFDKDNR